MSKVYGNITKMGRLDVADKDATGCKQVQILIAIRIWNKELNSTLSPCGCKSRHQDWEYAPKLDAEAGNTSGEISL